MVEFPSTAITRKSGELLDLADRGPVTITRYNRPRYVMMRIEEYSELHERAQDPRQAYSVDEAPEEHLAMLEESITEMELQR